MKQLQFLLVLLGIAIVAAPAFAYEVKGPVAGGDPLPLRDSYSCDDAVESNAYFQHELVAYGNAFDVGAGGPLSWIEFAHNGWSTLVGPYQYNVRVFDDITCTELFTIGPLEAADAYDHTEIEFEDLCAFDQLVAGPVVIGVEPLSCTSPTDCYPDVWFDDAPDGCDRIVDLAAPDCTPIFSGDFLLRIGVDECEPTPAASNSWGSIKSEFK